MKGRKLHSLWITLLIFLIMGVNTFAQEPAPGAEVGGYPHLERIEIPFTGSWQPTHDPLLLDENAIADIANMRPTDKAYKGVSGYTKINTAPFYASYHYTDFTETDTGDDRVSVAEYVITVTDVDTDEDVSVHYDSVATPFDDDFEHDLDFQCDNLSTGKCGLWALTNNVDRLFGLSDGDLDHLALRCDVSDGNDSYTKLLLPCNGADESTTFTDFSASNHTVTANGDAQIDTAQKKFGSASGLFDGTGDDLSIPDHADWFMDTGDFTIDGWFRFSQVTVGLSQYLFSQYVDANNFVWLKATDGGGSADHLTFEIADGKLDVSLSYTSWSYSTNTWYHIAVTRSGNDFDLFIDGVEVATLTDADPWPDLAGPVYIGSKDGSTLPLHGWTDELRVSKGIARWTTDFSGSLPTRGYGVPYLILQETNGAVDTTDESVDLDPDTTYYLTPERDEAVGTFGTLYCYIYSDSDRITSTDTLTVTLTEKQDFQHVFGMISYDGASGGNAWSGTISNFTGSVYDDIKSGFHFKKDQPAESHVMIQAANTAGTRSDIFINDTAIPDVGNFEDDSIHTDATGATRGRFTSAPQGNVVYCNGVESLIWGGDEGRCAAFILSTAAVTSSITNPKDLTEQIQNSLSSSDEVASINATWNDWVVGSTRPLKGIKYYVSTANDTASTTTGEYWDGSAWQSLTITDGTKPAAISLAQTGSMTWTDTDGLAEPKYLDGRVLYWYQFHVSAGTATISQVTVDADIQTIKNIWSGDSSIVAVCNRGQDSYTIEVNDPITSTVAVLDGLAGALTVGFLSPQQGFEIFIPSEKENSNASVLTVQYWDGNSWGNVTGQYDGTANGGATFAQSGVVSFSPLARGTEFPLTSRGQGPYYSYLLNVSLALDGETEIFYITGISNPPKVAAYKFAVDFQTRVLLCNGDASPESVLVSAENAPDVYNGADSTTLYFGGHDDLIAGVGMYNRFGSSIYNLATLCKRSETWVLNGHSPDTFEIYQISDTVGCCAPLTMDSCEIGYKLTKESIRNIAMWLSYDGPVIFDGGILAPIAGVEPYFDPNDDRCINYDTIDDSVGFFDPLLKEYNLLIPSGSGQTTLNVWPVYDLLRSKWFKKEPPMYPQSGFRVEDTDGAQYVYIGFKDGYLRRNEHGNNYDGEDIDQYITFRDLLPTKSMWDETRLDFLKLMCVAKNDGTEEDITIQWRKDGDTSWTDLVSAPMYATGKRYSAHVQRPHKDGISHELKLSVSTDDIVDGFEPIALGILYHAIRTDTIPD